MALANKIHAGITAYDRGTPLVLITLCLSCIVVLCTAARLLVRLVLRHMPTTEDVLIVIATAFAVGSTTAISFAVESGLGERSRLLDSENLSDIQKELYAATILYVLTVGFSKLSVTIFLSRLASGRVRTFGVLPLGAVILCWTFAATIGVAFECRMPRPWEVFTGHCFAIMPFWISLGSVDIATDIVMILLPIYIVSRLQLEHRKKIVMISFFALRLLLVVASDFRLVFLTHFDGSDPTWDAIPFEITTQCHSTLSVIIACLPGFKPFRDNVRAWTISVPLVDCRSGTRPTPGMSSTGSRTPPRPPSLPDELRPDLSMFKARVVANTPALKTSGEIESVRVMLEAQKSAHKARPGAMPNDGHNAPFI